MRLTSLGKKRTKIVNDILKRTYPYAMESIEEKNI